MLQRLFPAVLLLWGTLAMAAEPLTLWHSYRGAEEQALHQVGDLWNQAHPEQTLELLALPHEVLASKLTTAIPNGNGPDLFVFAHERVGGWAQSGILAPAFETLDDPALVAYLPVTVPPLTFEGKVWGLPLAFKSLALFYNKDLVQGVPQTTDELLALAADLEEGNYLLAWPSADFYFHAPWLHGFGGRSLDSQDRLAIEEKGALDSMAFVRDLQEQGLIPEEPTGALVTRLFNEGRVPFVVNGPWFLGEIKGEFGVASLPVISATGRAAQPFLTDEAVFVSAQARDGAQAVARFLAGRQSALIRARLGRQVVANASAWKEEDLAGDPVLSAFLAQGERALPMDNRPIMRSTWEPWGLALRRVLRSGDSPERAAAGAMRRFQAITRPAPAPTSSLPYLVLGALFLLAVLALLGRWLAVNRRDLGQTLRALPWVGPGLGATVLLVLAPFAVGLALSLFSHKRGEWTFVGLGNFARILGDSGFGVLQPLSFYYALAVTILWTVVNLALHVGVGLGLALLLNRKGLRLKATYRVLLILPWAVPNYITALIWKGLFHKQFGAINALLALVGVDPVAWFSSFPTAFFANVCANAWLGFPFMMVVCMGALQSIPSDLYEAADVDGAGRWDRLRHITLPLLRPALIPAILLGTVWTFNQFNIVYLVSGGEPDNATDILISEAWRWAFARQEQYGYAAAYAALIFVILLGWSLISTRIARSVETA